MTGSPEPREVGSPPPCGGGVPPGSRPIPIDATPESPPPGRSPVECRARSLEDVRSQLIEKLDLMHVGRDLIDRLIESLGAARGSLLMINPHTGRMRMVAGVGVPAELIGTDLKPASRRISDWVLRERQSLILHGVVRDRRFDSGVGGSGIESALCLPLLADGQALGVANLSRVSPSPMFREEDRQQAESLATALAAILNEVQGIGWARRSWNALGAATGGRSSVLWSTPRYEIATCRVSSRLERGDLVERAVHDDGSQTLLVADVAGWGSEAHAAAAFLRGLFQAFGRSRGSPSAFATAINIELCRRQAPPAALWLAHLGGTGRLLSCVAGLPPPMVVAPGQGGARQLTAGGPMAGALPDAVFDQESLQLLPGDRVLAVTDGIPNASNAAGEWFGLERVGALATEHRQQPVARLSSVICSEALAFSGLHSPVDDLMVVALRYSRDE